MARMNIRAGTRVRLLGEMEELIEKQRADALRDADVADRRLDYWKKTTPEEQLKKCMTEQRDLVVLSDISGFSIVKLLEGRTFLVVDEESKLYGRIGLFDGRYLINQGGRVKGVKLESSQVYEARNGGMVLEEYRKRFDENGQMRI